jgi:hypothetical protein
MIIKFKEFESLADDERYLSDEEIEAGYNNFKITEFSVDRIRDDGGAGGWITIEFPPDEDDEDPGVEEKTDHWIKYDSGPNWGFDNWYPDNLTIKLKEYIEIGILIKKKYPNLVDKELRKYIEEQIETNKFNL